MLRWQCTEAIGDATSKGIGDARLIADATCVAQDAARYVCEVPVLVDVAGMRPCPRVLMIQFDDVTLSIRVKDVGDM